MRRRIAQLKGDDAGNVMVTFALLATAMFGMLALAIDLGFLFGQRRFDQNGADAAALAVARKLATEVSAQGTSVVFTVADATVYQIARHYAGLDAASLASAVPTGINQNAGLTSRNQLSVMLEYCARPTHTGANGNLVCRTDPDPTLSDWCISPSSPRWRNPSVTPPESARAPGAPVCSLPTASGVAYPPLPTVYPYRIRVTVSSTTDGFFTRVIGQNDGLPAAPSDEAIAACIRPQVRTVGTWTMALVGGLPAPGNTTCAHAVAAVQGSSVPVAVNAPVPVTIGDCRVGGALGQLVRLWGPNSQPCPPGANFNINNVLDFTADSKWCDDPSGGSQTNPDYTFTGVMPPGALGQGNPNCPGTAAPDNSWNRGAFQADPSHIGNVKSQDDVAYWIAKSFGGANWQQWVGVKFPIYQSASPGQGGNLGQNIADGFYCGGTQSVTASSCTANTSGTYFFAKYEPDGVTPRAGFYEVCPDEFGAPPYNLGCREAAVLTWSNAEWVNNQGTGWNSSNNGAQQPQRVQIARILNFRFYCSYNGTLCTESPPNTVPGVQNAGNSGVFGRFIAPFVSACPTAATCVGGPSLNGNTVAFES